MSKVSWRTYPSPTGAFMYELTTSRYEEVRTELRESTFVLFPPQDGPPAESFVNPQRTGWLTKLGGSGMGANWRKRWFVLDHHYIFYYKQKNVRAVAVREAWHGAVYTEGRQNCSRSWCSHSLHCVVFQWMF